MYTWLEENKKIVEEQAEFCKSYYTVDHVFALNAIVQRHLEKHEANMYVAFVDFRKAIDSVRHCELLEAIRIEGVSGNFAGAIRAMYSSLLFCFRMKNEYTDFFECLNDVRQGCVLSPTLFCLLINQLAEHVRSFGKDGAQILPGFTALFILLFANDETLSAITPSRLQTQS